MKESYQPTEQSRTDRSSSNQADQSKSAAQGSIHQGQPDETKRDDRPAGVILRQAVKEDCPRLLELVHELALFEKAPEEVTVTLEHFTESGFGKDPVWWAFVVCVNDKIEGFALYYVRYSTWKGQRLYLEDLIVTEKMR